MLFSGLALLTGVVFLVAGFCIFVVHITGPGPDNEEPDNYNHVNSNVPEGEKF